MSFVTPFQTEFFLVDRVTTHGRLVRRVIVIVSDGAILMCKPSGAVCRVMHAGNITSIVVAPWEGIANVGVLFRFESEPDLLFRHIMPQRNSNGLSSHVSGLGQTGIDADGLIHSHAAASSSVASIFHGNRGQSSSGAAAGAASASSAPDFVMASHLLQTAHRFMQCVNVVRQVVGTVAMGTVGTRNSLEELVGTADLQRFAGGGRRKPEFSPITSTMLLPTIFDAFEVQHLLGAANRASPLANTAAEGGGFGHAVPEPVNMFVDVSFLTMLSHAIERSPLAGTTAPLVTVEAPAPFKSVTVNDKFFEAYTAAYCRSVSVVINAHGPLPHLVSFRASPGFWQFAKRRNHLVKSAPRTLANLLADHVEVYIAGEEDATTMCLPLVEWNQTIVDWELQVRARTDAADDATAKAYRNASSQHGGDGVAGPDEAVWASFLQEAHAMMVSYDRGALQPSASPQRALGANRRDLLL